MSWIGQYAERNSALADILCDLGAVLFVKTNIPQTLMVFVPPSICESDRIASDTVARNF